MANDGEGILLPEDLGMNVHLRRMESRIMDALSVINESAARVQVNNSNWRIRRHRRSVVIPQMLEVLTAINDFSKVAHNEEFDAMMNEALVFFDSQQHGLVAWLRREIEEANKAAEKEQETADVNRDNADGLPRDEGSEDLSGRGQAGSGSGIGEDQTSEETDKGL